MRYFLVAKTTFKIRKKINLPRWSVIEKSSVFDTVGVRNTPPGSPLAASSISFASGKTFSSFLLSQNRKIIFSVNLRIIYFPQKWYSQLLAKWAVVIAQGGMLPLGESPLPVQWRGCHTVGSKFYHTLSGDCPVSGKSLSQMFRAASQRRTTHILGGVWERESIC